MRAPGARVRWTVLVVGALLSASTAASVEGPDPSPKSEVSVSRSSGSTAFEQIRLSQFLDAAAVRRALAGARRRLEEPRCREILTEFTDAEGHTLQANLDAQGRTAQQHLDRLLFYDGASERRCLGSATMALSNPGELVVRICPAFAAVGDGNRRYAEVILLHEMLHTLGLGENPPTSSAITGVVMKRCGR